MPFLFFFFFFFLFSSVLTLVTSSSKVNKKASPCRLLLCLLPFSFSPFLFSPFFPPLLSQDELRVDTFSLIFLAFLAP